MEFLKNNARGIVIALLAVGIITAVSASGNDDDTPETTQEDIVSQTENLVQTQEQDDEAAAESSEEAETEAEEATPATNSDGERESAEVAVADGQLSATARGGDNQTTLIRDIIDQYKDGADTELSAEQMLFVETQLVNALPKSDLIFVGDVVAVSEEQVKSSIDAAGDLSEAGLALWARYL